MKKLLIIFLFFCFSSCKKEINKPIITKNTTIKKDTIKCDFNTDKIVKSTNTSMYNTPYIVDIGTSYLLDQKIITQHKNNINLCYDKQAQIVLLQKSDTIFNVSINSNYLYNNYNSFYTQIANKYKDENHIDVSTIPKPSKTLLLDSVVHSGARTNYIYFTCYHTDYKTNKKYSSDIGINYLDKNNKTILFSQLSAD